MSLSTSYGKSEFKDTMSSSVEIYELESGDGRVHRYHWYTVPRRVLNFVVLVATPIEKGLVFPFRNVPPLGKR